MLHKIFVISKNGLAINILYIVAIVQVQTLSLAYFSACGISSANICYFLFNTEQAEQTLYL